MSRRREYETLHTRYYELMDELELLVPKLFPGCKVIREFVQTPNSETGKYCQQIVDNKQDYVGGPLFQGLCAAKAYYPGELHFLDGNPKNKLHGNIAVICSLCGAHILQSRFDVNDIARLKGKGLNNAQIGNILGLSRERVRKLASKVDVTNHLHEDGQNQDFEKTARLLQSMEKRLHPRKTRVVDIRTIRKRLRVELEKRAHKEESK